MWGYSIRRAGYILQMATVLLSYAVTKHQHWTLVHEFRTLHIEHQGFDEHTQRLRRGGRAGVEGLWRAPYSERELAVVEQVNALNRRSRATDLTRAVGRQILSRSAHKIGSQDRLPYRSQSRTFRSLTSPGDHG
jgi:hypothetical protein